MKNLLIIMILISSLACSNSKNTNNVPEMDLHSAVFMNDLSTIDAHIKAGSDLNIKDPMGGSTPLISACVFGKAEAAKTLIQGGALLDLRNNEGSTALYCAAFFGHEEIVQALLQKGADKSIKNNFGSDALSSVSIPFDQVKPIYDVIGKDMGPLGLKLDYTHLEKTRPVIANLLK